MYRRRHLVTLLLPAVLCVACWSQKGEIYRPPEYHPAPERKEPGAESSGGSFRIPGRVRTVEPESVLGKTPHIFDRSELLKKIYPQPLAQQKIGLISLVSDNDATDDALRRDHKLRSMRLRPKGYSFEDVEAVLKQNAGKVVFFMGHTEGGKFVVTDAAGRLKAPPIDLATLFDRAKKLGVIPFILGCNSARFVSAGVNNEFSSVQAVQMIQHAINSETVGAFIDSLESGALEVRLSPSTVQDIAGAIKFDITYKDSKRDVGVLYVPKGCTSTAGHPCPIPRPAAPQVLPSLPYGVSYTLPKETVWTKLGDFLRNQAWFFKYLLPGLLAYGMTRAAHRFPSVVTLQWFGTIFSFIGGAIAVPAAIIMILMKWSSNVDSIERMTNSGGSLWLLVLYPINHIFMIFFLMLVCSAPFSFRLIRIAMGTFFLSYSLVFLIGA